MRQGDERDHARDHHDSDHDDRDQRRPQPRQLGGACISGSRGRRTRRTTPDRARAARRRRRIGGRRAPARAPVTAAVRTTGSSRSELPWIVAAAGARATMPGSRSSARAGRRRARVRARAARDRVSAAASSFSVTSSGRSRRAGAARRRTRRGPAAEARAGDAGIAHAAGSGALQEPGWLVRRRHGGHRTAGYGTSARQASTTRSAISSAEYSLRARAAGDARVGLGEQRRERGRQVCASYGPQSVPVDPVERLGRDAHRRREHRHVAGERLEHGEAEALGVGRHEHRVGGVDRERDMVGSRSSERRAARTPPATSRRGR